MASAHQMKNPALARKWLERTPMTQDVNSASALAPAPLTPHVPYAALVTQRRSLTRGVPNGDIPQWTIKGGYCTWAHSSRGEKPAGGEEFPHSRESKIARWR